MLLWEKAHRVVPRAVYTFYYHVERCTSVDVLVGGWIVILDDVVEYRFLEL